jgi:twitching motility protein PilI
LPEPMNNAFELLRNIDVLSKKYAAPLPRQEQLKQRWKGIGFLLNQTRFIAPLAEVAEILSVPSFTRIPGVQSWALGLANVRGTLLPVVDLRRFLGFPPLLPNKRNRLLVINHAGLVTGLLVEEVLGLQSLYEELRGPELIQQADPLVAPYVISAFHPAALEDDSEQNNKLLFSSPWLVFSLFALAREPSFLLAAS